MTPAGAEDGVIRRRVTLPPRSFEEDCTGANAAKVDKLRLNRLRRQARELGLELRHTSYGYALFDAARRRVDDRNDLTLDDVESRLTRT